MSTPIEPEDIRVGDLVRWESLNRSGPHAVEYEVQSEDRRIMYANGRYFLLDRPKPAVVLPDEPTLGILTTGTGRRVGHWSADPRDGYEVIEYSAAGGPISPWSIGEVVSFEPAIAVPTEALGTLRSGADCSGPLSCAKGHMRDFLDAIDGGGE